MSFMIKMGMLHLLRLKIEIIKNIRCYLIDALTEPNALSILVEF